MNEINVESLRTRLIELDSQILYIINLSVEEFSDQVLSLFKNAPIPDSINDINRIKKEIKELENKKELVIQSDNVVSTKAHKLKFLKAQLLEASQAFSANELLRAFKRQVVYMMERTTDLLLKEKPDKYAYKIRIIDQSLRQIEVICSPRGQASPEVDFVEGVATRAADTANAIVLDNFTSSLGKLTLGRNADGTPSVHMETNNPSKLLE